MKSFLKTAAITVLALVLTTLGWVGAIALGWLPVPAFVTDQVARAQGLSPAEAHVLNRTVNLYATLRQSPDAPVLDKALDMVTQGVTDDRSWLNFAREEVPRLEPATLERIRDQLEIEPQDFDRVWTVLETLLKDSSADALPALTKAQAQALTDFEARYHLVETFSKFQ